MSGTKGATATDKQCAILEHQRDLLREIFIHEEEQFVPLEKKCAILELEILLLSKILDNRGASYSMCGCGEKAYYFDHYDDDKVHCRVCREDTCIKCIGNHCNSCNNYYNIICKRCVDEIGKSRWDPECRKLLCPSCPQDDTTSSSESE